MEYFDFIWFVLRSLQCCSVLIRYQRLPALDIQIIYKNWWRSCIEPGSWWATLALWLSNWNAGLAYSIIFNRIHRINTSFILAMTLPSTKNPPCGCWSLTNIPLVLRMIGWVVCRAFIISSRGTESGRSMGVHCASNNSFNRCHCLLVALIHIFGLDCLSQDPRTLYTAYRTFDN